MADGILIVDKPADMTSYDVIRRLKKIFETKRIGHGGTLDPFATGVLVIAINQATKIIRYFLEGDKSYIAKLKLGEMTDTFDLTGNVKKKSDREGVTKKELKDVLKGFIGVQTQMPPMYSAKKVNGKKLYEMARKGIEIERRKSKIDIKDISLLGFDYPFVTISVDCSKGTYIRSLANDIGLTLGTYAHLVELARTFSEPFSIERAVKLCDLERKKDEGTLAEHIISMNDALSFLPGISVKKSAEKKVMHGIYLTDEDIIRGGVQPENTARTKKERVIRLVSDKGELLALASYVKMSNEYKYKKVFIR